MFELYVMGQHISLYVIETTLYKIEILDTIQLKIVQKRLQWNIENINGYDCNQTFTNESDFGIRIN